MRYDRNLDVFLGHSEWYYFEDGSGYIPTEKAPKEAAEAMRRFNAYTYGKKTKQNPPSEAETK